MFHAVFLFLIVNNVFLEPVLLQKDRQKDKMINTKKKFPVDALEFKKRESDWAKTCLTKVFLSNASQMANCLLLEKGPKKTKTDPQNLISLLTSEEMSVICQKNMSAGFRYPEVLSLLPASCVAGINTSSCLLKLPCNSDSGILAPFSPGQISRLRNDLFIHMPDDGLIYLGENIRHVNDTAWKTVVFHLKCKNLTAKSLCKMSYTKLKDITPECLANMCDLDTADLPLKAVSSLPDNVFSLVKKKLSPSFFQGMNSEQVAMFGSKNDKYDQDFPLDPRHLHLRVLSSITKTQFFVFLSKADGVVTLGKKKIKRLAQNILAECHLCGLKKLDQKELKFYGSRLSMIAPLYCSFFTTVSEVGKIGSFNPSGKCISYFQKDVLIDFLANKAGKLQPNSLHWLSKNMLAELRYKDAEGIFIFNKLKIPTAVLKEIGVKVRSPQHPCRLITTHEMFKQCKWIPLGLGPTCLNVLPFYREISSSEYHRFPHDTIVSLHVRDMERLLIPNYIGSLNETHIHKLMQKPQFCSTLTYRLFVEFNKKLYSIFTPECVSRFTFLGKLSPLDLKYIPGKMFRCLDETHKLDFTQLHPEHFQELGIERDGRVCQNIDGKTLSLLRPNQTNNINATCLKQIPDISWENFTEEQFKHLKNKVFRILPKSAVENMHINIISLFTRHQMRILGKDLKNKSSSQLPCHAFIERAQEIDKQDEATKYCK